VADSQFRRGGAASLRRRGGGFWGCGVGVSVSNNEAVDSFEGAEIPDGPMRRTQRVRPGGGGGGREIGP